MPLARWQATIVDDAGNVIPSPFVEVRRESAGASLAILYSDRDGANPLGNPFQVATADGFAFFHVIGGAYKVRVYSGAFEKIHRYVAIGTAGETDFAQAFVPKGAWSNVTTYAIGDLVSSVNGGDPYAFVSNEDGNLNHAPPFSGAIGTSDAHWTVVGLIESPGSPGVDGAPGSSDVVGTSISNVAIGIGAKVFNIVETDRGWGVGARLRVSSDASPTTAFMEGVVASYAANVLTLTVDIAQGAGSHSDWTINLAGQVGTAAATVRMVTAAGAVTVANADEVILLNKAAGAATNVNFPKASDYTGNGISVKDIKGDAATNNITPVFDGAETCDGAPGSDFVININYGEAGVFRPLPSGTGWYLLTR